MKKAYLLFLVCFFIMVILAQGDILYLSNGRGIEGIIAKESDDWVELEIYGGSVKFDKGDIEKIVRSSEERAMELRQQWDKEKIVFEAKLGQQQFKKEIQGSSGPEIVVGALLNNKVFARLLLDTGASSVMLTRSKAAELGIASLVPAPEGEGEAVEDVYKIKMQLADGRSVEAMPIMLESVKVEDSEANNVAAVVLVEEVAGFKYDGLLGMSFLANFNFRVDNTEKKLVLEKLR
ncbi:MAG: retroviral-like aspartic protease family protein [Candidatus Omnitrophica bacterium]|nr:retroviral-like aspartic protease family protein [Candidatus Omnitrophota bacterium]